VDFEDSIKEAARRADAATRDAMAAYRDETVEYEPVITGGLATSLRTALNGQIIQDLIWSAHVFKSGTGSGREETPIGADLLIHVQFDTPSLKYSKGVLVQAKRLEPAVKMTTHARGGAPASRAARRSWSRRTLSSGVAPPRRSPPCRGSHSSAPSSRAAHIWLASTERRGQAM